MSTVPSAAMPLTRKPAAMAALIARLIWARVAVAGLVIAELP